MKVKFIKVLDDRSGTTSSGHDWRDVQFLCETTEERPRKIALNSKGLDLQNEALGFFM